LFDVVAVVVESLLIETASKLLVVVDSTFSVTTFDFSFTSEASKDSVAKTIFESSGFSVVSLSVVTTFDTVCCGDSVLLDCRGGSSKPSTMTLEAVPATKSLLV